VQKKDLLDLFPICTISRVSDFLGVPIQGIPNQVRNDPLRRGIVFHCEGKKMLDLFGFALFIAFGNELKVLRVANSSVFP